MWKFLEDLVRFDKESRRSVATSRTTPTTPTTFNMSVETSLTDETKKSVRTTNTTVTSRTVGTVATAKSGTRPSSILTSLAESMLGGSSLLSDSGLYHSLLRHGMAVVTVNKIRVSDVDLAREEFSAELSVRFSWKRLATKKSRKDRKQEPWNPDPFIDNLVAVSYESSRTVEIPEVSEVLVTKEILVAGTFRQPMNWLYYPFDSHKLRVTILSRRHPDDVLLVSSSYGDEGLQNVVVNDGINNELFLYGGWASTEVLYSGEGRAEGVYIEVTARRKFGFYNFNYFFMEFIISLLTLLTVADSYSPKQRITTCILAVTMSVLLKCIVFPQGSKYSLSAADVYHLYSLMYHCLILSYHSMSNRAGDLMYEDLVRRLLNVNDSIAFVLFALCLVVFHVAFACWIAKKPEQDPRDGSDAQTSIVRPDWIL